VPHGAARTGYLRDMAFVQGRVCLGVISSTVAAVALIAASGASGSPGDLDPSLSDGGLLRDRHIPPAAAMTAFGGSNLAVASVRSGGGSNGSSVVLSEYNESGKPLTAFGQKGRIAVPTPDGFATDDASGTQLQALGDGRLGLIVEEGSRAGDSQGDLATLVSDSGLQAQLRTPIGSVIEPTGLIIYPAGSSVHGTDWNGDPDPTFGVGGTAALPASFVSPTLTATADGSVIATDADSGQIARLNPMGQVDASFGPGGAVALSSLAGATLIDTEVDQAGRVYVLFRQEDALGDEMLARIRADGALDSTFGQGVGMVDLHTLNPRRIAPLPDGSSMVLSFMSSSYMSASRISTDGNLDASYGARGYIRVYFGLGMARAESAITVDALGRTIIGGAVGGYYSEAASLGIARLSASPGPDDLDADGFLDRKDSCPVGASEKHHGCPIDRRTLKVHAMKRGIRGQVRAQTIACLHVPLKVVPVEGGNSTQVVTHVRRGRGTFEQRLPRGRYRVVAQAKVPEGRARCSAALRTIRIR
jgi:hypothetical protein